MENTYKTTIEMDDAKAKAERAGLEDAIRRFQGLNTELKKIEVEYQIEVEHKRTCLNCKLYSFCHLRCQVSNAIRENSWMFSSEAMEVKWPKIFETLAEACNYYEPSPTRTLTP